ASLEVIGYASGVLPDFEAMEPLSTE
ncbi:UNVERIFIED_ORG: hypothetical protein GGI65_001407, partial [Rhizobium esperanzae]